MNPWATDCCNVTYTGLEQPIIQIIDDIGCIYECKYNLFLIIFFYINLQIDLRQGLKIK